MIMVEEIEIDNKSYKLSTRNFINKSSKKNKILIADTYNKDMRHFLEWGLFNNGSFNKTAHYTINIEGKIFEHVSPKKGTNFLKDDKRECIIILIENLGWLKKIGSGYKTWNDEIYSGEVIEQPWRDKKYWVKYNDNQIESTANLVKYLTKEMGIKTNIKTDSFLDDNIDKFKGVIYRSNLSKIFKDINPSWNFEKIKEYNSLN